MARTQLLRGIDAAWRRMDRDPQQALITALMKLAGPLDRGALAAALRRVVATQPAFRMRVVDRGLLGVVFEPDELFDLENHLHRVAAPSPGDDAALAELLSELASAPLNPARPLWDLHIVDLREGSALIARIHHCIADGVALVRVLLGIVDGGETEEPDQVGWTPPSVTSLRTRAGHLAEEAATLGRTILLSSDAPSALRGPLGAAKRVAWTAAFPVTEAKRIAATVSGHLNDTLIAAVAGGLAAYAQHLGRPLEVDPRAMVPVFLRGGHEPSAELGNAFGLVYLALPTGIDEASERLAESKRRMDAIKSTSETSNAVALLGLIGRVTPAMERLAIRLFTAKASLVFTNVPGPPFTIRIAGSEVTALMVWAPYAGDLALSITAVSYGGELRFGVLANGRVLPEPSLLAVEIERALAELSRVTTRASRRGGTTTTRSDAAPTRAR